MQKNIANKVKISSDAIQPTFVTQKSSPVLLTGAGPGFHAGAMHTARVRQTLIAQWALPSILTPTKPTEHEQECV